ncbi:MAG: GNAT family N-acetyltransferase [Lachnospiraceae bacterium]|nr:GNAT family N-acetyltransferase [Lachnospiraceae bacterium]
MKVEEKEIKLKDGRMLILRSPKLSDAEELIEYLKVTAGETEFLLKYPEEVNITIEQEEGILQWFLDSDRDLMIIAEVDGKIAGNCSLSPVGKKIRVRHRCSIGIALYEEYWGLGIGTALLKYLIEKAKEMGYEQMELVVVKRNEQAIALYKKMGFVECGGRPNAMKHKDGSYDDDIIMVKEFIGGQDAYT